MKIIAHRGASGEFPENSLLAFEQAIKQGADGIELDAQYHVQSDSFILLHDSYLESTTNGKGDLNKFTLAQLKSFDLGHNEKLVTLPEALEKIAGRCIVNIELKTLKCSSKDVSTIISALEKLLNHAIKYDNFTSKDLIISSFDHHLIYQSKKVLPDIKTAALIAHRPLEYASFTHKLGIDSLNPDIDCVHSCLVEDAHQHGLEVWVYTVDREEDIARCIEMKVDAFFTNHPKKSRKTVQKLQKT